MSSLGHLCFCHLHTRTISDIRGKIILKEASRKHKRANGSGKIKKLSIIICNGTKKNLEQICLLLSRSLEYLVQLHFLAPAVYAVKLQLFLFFVWSQPYANKQNVLFK